MTSLVMSPDGRWLYAGIQDGACIGNPHSEVHSPPTHRLHTVDRPTARTAQIRVRRQRQRVHTGAPV